MARDDPEVRFRCPPELKAQLEESARKAGRSMNGEIVHRLHRTYDKPIDVEAWDARIARLTEFMGELGDTATRVERAVKEAKALGINPGPSPTKKH